MKKKKKKKTQAFTLMELLGVIIILAIVALITTPLAMRVIVTSKKQAATNTGISIIDAAKQKATAEDIKVSSPPYHYDESSGLTLNGKKPTKFNLILNENMDSQLQAWINGFCVTKEFSDKTPSIDESKKTESECVNGGSSITKKYENGEAIYFNPETNQKCSASDYTVENSLKENKSGCMKWYTFNDTEESDTVNVILDHNTTYQVAWNASEEVPTEMKEVKAALESDVSNWHDDIKKTARLIEANEIAQITGNTEFDATNPDKDIMYWLEDSAYNEETGGPTSFPQPGEAKYKWLFDYTYGCRQYGCEFDLTDDAYESRAIIRVTVGYWTSTPSMSSPGNAWNVESAGIVNNDYADNFTYGVRPVITISKSVLK